MATTTVKLTKRGKEILDKLQARLVLLGYRYTKEEILELVLETGSKKPGDLIARAEGIQLPIPNWEQVFEEVVASAEDWGPTSWRDIDPILYGGKRRR